MLDACAAGGHIAKPESERKGREESSVRPRKRMRLRGTEPFGLITELGLIRGNQKRYRDV